MFSAPKIGLLLVATCCALLLEGSAHGDQAFDVVNATYNTGAEVPISSDGFTALGKTVNLRLNYVPTAGTQLTVVQNKGSGMIRRTFRNLAQGQIVGLSYGGVTYSFVANYRGGKGNDLVLLWTTGEEQPPQLPAGNSTIKSCWP